MRQMYRTRWLLSHVTQLFTKLILHQSEAQTHMPKYGKGSSIPLDPDPSAS